MTPPPLWHFFENSSDLVAQHFPNSFHKILLNSLLDLVWFGSHCLYVFHCCTYCWWWCCCCCWFQGEGKEEKGLVASAGKLELKINLQLAPGATENCHVGLLRGIAQNSHHSPENLPSLWFDHFSNEMFSSCKICYFPPPQKNTFWTHLHLQIPMWALDLVPKNEICITHF